jgi:hypothetical protein
LKGTPRTTTKKYGKEVRQRSTAKKYGKEVRQRSTAKKYGKEAKEKVDYGTLWNGECGGLSHEIEELHAGSGTDKRKRARARGGARERFTSMREGFRRGTGFPFDGVSLRHLETRPPSVTPCGQREMEQQGRRP